jgi:hypothetical protein
VSTPRSRTSKTGVLACSDGNRAGFAGTVDAGPAHATLALQRSTALQAARRTAKEVIEFSREEASAVSLQL